MEDYQDIVNWGKNNDKFSQFFSRTDRKKVKKSDLDSLRLKGIDPIYLYCLIKTKLTEPNGVYTMTLNGEPIENLFWWDFVLQSDIGFIHVWRKQSHIEFMHEVDDPNFNVITFFKKNIGKYIDEVRATMNKLETHTLYINHYQSYKGCADYLIKEVQEIDISYPDITNKKEFEKNFTRFSTNSIKFHALGKSHILNCAFKIESFLNLFIRITFHTDVKDYPDVQKKFLDGTFNDKLKNLKFYSMFLEKPVDMEEPIIHQTMQLMKLRNKYVHFDESSEINRVGQVKFDGRYPVFPEYSESPLIEHIKRSYHNPSLDELKKAQLVSDNFIGYIVSLVFKQYRETLLFVMTQNPIGYNENKRIYSAVFSWIVADLMMEYEDDTPEDKE